MLYVISWQLLILVCCCWWVNDVFRVALTMTVSAFWHGVHAGYYLSFLTIPPNLIAEDLMRSALRSTDPGQTTRFDWICWFFKMRSFEYMSMSFLLLGFTATLRYWSSIYFLGHVVIVMFIVVGWVFRSPRPGAVSSTKTDWTLLLTFWWLGSVTVRTLDLRSRGRLFDSRSVRYQVVSTQMGDSLRTGKPSRYITNHQGQLSLSSLQGR